VNLPICTLLTGHRTELRITPFQEGLATPAFPFAFPFDAEAWMPSPIFGIVDGLPAFITAEGVLHASTQRTIQIHRP
jgi:hypothetical protein